MSELDDDAGAERDPLDSLRDLAGGEPGGDADRDDAKPRRSRKRASEAGRRSGPRARSGPPRPPEEKRLRESIEAVADWLIARGDDELGGVVRRDAPKMARVLGTVANVNPAAKRAVQILADVLEPVRAFGPTLRIVWGRMLERRAAHAEELEQEPGDELYPGVAVPTPAPAEPAADEPVVAEPWRIRG